MVAKDSDGFAGQFGGQCHLRPHHLLYHLHHARSHQQFLLTFVAAVAIKHADLQFKIAVIRKLLLSDVKLQDATLHQIAFRKAGFALL